MDIAFVLEHLAPESLWTLDGDEYDGLTWLSDDPKPSLSLIKKTWAELEKEYFLIPVRKERNRLLSGSDWTQVADTPVDQQAWAEYRQQLRDLPANTEDPQNPEWPTPPE